MEGGTNIYCPECNAVKECKVVKNPRITSFDRDGGNYLNDLEENAKGTQIHYFLRNRQCLSCCSDFETYELNSTTVEFLIREKKLLDEIRKTITDSGSNF